MKARFSMATRAFLLAFVPMCLVLAASFLTINHAIRKKMKAGIQESLSESGRTVNAARTAYDHQYRQLVESVTAEGDLESWYNSLPKTPARETAISQLHERIGSQLARLGQLTDYDLLVISDYSGNPIVGCIRNTSRFRTLNSFPAKSVGAPPFCRDCHTASVVNLTNVEGKIYEINNMPIRREASIVGYLTIGKRFGTRSPSDFIHVALVNRGRILLTTFPSDEVREVERQLQTECGSMIDGCEIKLNGKSFLALDVSGASASANSRLYGFQSIDAVMNQFTPRFKQDFLVIGSGGILLVLLFSTLGSRSLTKPITDLVSHLRESERAGKLRSDFAVNSSAKEVNVLAEALNRAADAIRRSHEELEALTGRLISAKEDESKRLARELHDVFSQRLALLGMEISAIRQQFASLSHPANERLRWMGEEIGKLAGEVHQLSRQLHPSMLDDLGLTVALRAECDTFSKQHRVSASFVPTSVPESLPSRVALSLYRITQEALWNVAKYAEAKTVMVTLAGSAEEIVLTVQDDGKGFNLGGMKRKGLGLVSMEERARLVGGSFSIQSQPGKGTRVEARIPVPRQEA